MIKLENDKINNLHFLTPLNKGYYSFTFSIILYFIIVLVYCMSINRDEYYHLNMPLGSAITIYSGLVLIIITYSVGLFETGVEADLIKNQFRKYRGGKVIRIGKWKPIPPKDYFLITKNTKRNLDLVQDKNIFNLPSFYYDLTLITTGDFDVLISSTEFRNEVLILARDLSNKYNLFILERTINGDNRI